MLACRRRCRCLYALGDFGTSTRGSPNQPSYIVSDRSGKRNPLSHRAIVLCARPDEHGIIENSDGATGLRQLRWYLPEQAIRPAISFGVVSTSAPCYYSVVGAALWGL
jgi:hypothetical protein